MTHMHPLYLVILLLSSTLCAQQGIVWSEPIDVSLTSGNASPVVQVFGDGSPAVIWGKGSDIYFTRMLDDTFLEPIILNTGSNSPDIYTFGGIDMAVQDSLVIVVYENFENGVFTIRSTDGGKNFDAPVSVYDPIPGKWATLPSIELHQNGNPLVSVILENTNETEGRYIVLRSQDGGLTYGEPVIASEPANGDAVCECCPSDSITQGDEVYLVYRNNDNNLRDMWVSKSIDGGQTFTQAVDIDATDWMLNACPISGPKMAQFAADSLLTIWKSAASGESRVYVSTFNSATMAKGYEQELPLSNMFASQGSSAAAGTQDTIGIVWSETGFGANSTDLVFALSTTGSADLFGNYANVTEAPSFQNFPSLAYANGEFHLLYTDGAGLQYKRGTVLGTSAVNDVILEENCFRILNNPCTNGTIEVQNTCPVENQLRSVSITNYAGQVLRKWQISSVFADNILSLHIADLIPGIHILSIESGSSTWVEKVVIKG